MKKTVLITGGAGYIGSHTAYQMAQKGYNVLVVDALIHGQTFQHDWAQFYHGDYADAHLLTTIFNTHTIDIVMHFAAFIEVGQSVKDPQPFYYNNVVKTIELLNFIKQRGVKNFVFSSTCAVYGNPHYLPLDEQHPKNPVSPYGANKLVVEHVLADYARAYNFDYVSLRYFNAAGGNPELNMGELHVPETHIIPLLLRAAHFQTPFYIFGNDYDTPDGTCIRDYVHVTDIADAHVRAADYLGQGGDSVVCNLGTGTGHSVHQMIQAAQRVSGTHIKTVVSSRRQGDPARLVANNDKAQKILGWKIEHSDIESILRDARAWEIKHNYFKDHVVETSFRSALVKGSTW